MRLLRVTEEGGSYKVRLEEAPEPVPAAGEVLMKVAASGLNRADLSQIAGRYPPPPGEPEILGLEASGALVSSGEEVCALLAGGGHAEYAAVPEGQLLPCPRKVDLLTAAGIPEVWATAFLNLVLEGGLKAGDRVLIQAGASGVGLAAVQLARLLEAHVAAAIHIPLHELARDAARLDRGSAVALICATGYRSTIAASVLEREGFSHLINVVGGMNAWSSAHYDTVV